MVDEMHPSTEDHLGYEKRFRNQVVLVTGAARGIGLAIAKAFLLAGARVVVNDLYLSDLQMALDQFGSIDTGDVLAVATDVRDALQVSEMVNEVTLQWGRIDILVNNAGIYPSQPVLEMSEEDWDRVMDTNAKGTFLVSQAVANHMVANRIRGQIVNISSGSYHRGRIGSAHYCASKAAMVMFTKVLAMELAPYGIRVNSVAPGLIRTDTLDLDPAYVEATCHQIPAGRLGTPEDVAAVVIGLAGLESDYVTGTVVAVDGGLALGRYGIPSA